MLACKYCSISMVHPDAKNHRSTSAMGKHLQVCELIESMSRKRIYGVKSAGSKTPKVVEFTEHEYRLRALKMQLANHLSFNFWSNPMTREFITFLKSDAPPLNRHNMALFLSEQANEIHNSIADKLKTNTSKVSLALDAWSAPYSKKSYMCKMGIIIIADDSGITAHLIDNDWNLVDVRNGRNGRARTRRTGHGEGTLGAERAQQAGIMHSEIGFTVAKTMEASRSVCREEFSP